MRREVGSPIGGVVDEILWMSLILTVLEQWIGSVGIGTPSFHGQVTTIHTVRQYELFI